MLLSSYLSGYLLEFFVPQNVLAGQAVIQAGFLLATAFLWGETRVESSDTLDLVGDGSPAALVEGDQSPGGRSGVSAASRASGRGSLLDQWHALASDPKIWAPALFVMLYISGPNYDDAIWFFYTNKLGWGPEFMGRLVLFHALARVVGLFVYRTYLTKVPIKQLYWKATVFSTPFYALPAFDYDGSVQNAAYESRLARHRR